LISVDRPLAGSTPEVKPLNLRGVVSVDLATLYRGHTSRHSSVVTRLRSRASAHNSPKEREHSSERATREPLRQSCELPFRNVCADRVWWLRAGHQHSCLICSSFTSSATSDISVTRRIQANLSWTSAVSQYDLSWNSESRKALSALQISSDASRV